MDYLQKSSTAFDPVRWGTQSEQGKPQGPDESLMAMPIHGRAIRVFWNLVLRISKHLLDIVG